VGCLIEELKILSNLRSTEVLWVYIIEMRTAERDNPTLRYFLKHISLRCCILKGLNKAEIIFENSAPLTFVGRFRVRLGVVFRHLERRRISEHMI